MSRRFGRNQKRRMREELAAAQSDAARNDSLARGCTERAKRAEAQCDRALEREANVLMMLEATAAIVGRQAMAAGMPTNFEADWLNHGQKNFRLPVPIFMSEVPSYGVRCDEPAVMVCNEIMRLLEVEAVRRPVSNAMHVLVTFDDIPIGYALSDSALRSLPEKMLADLIARELRPLLVNAIQELKGRRK